MVPLRKMNHIHVGHNVPGYLPETEPVCFASLGDAFLHLLHEIKDYQQHCEEHCTGHCEDCAEYERCECEWCDLYGFCEAVIGSIADGDMQYRFRRNGEEVILMRTPEGSDIVYWISDLTEFSFSRDICGLNEDN